MAFEEADHSQLLKSLGWLDVIQLIDFDIASLMYKITNGMTPEKHKHPLINAKACIHVTQEMQAPAT